MPKSETLILTAEVGFWMNLLAILEEGGQQTSFSSQLRYKLWRTGHLDSPLP